MGKGMRQWTLLAVGLSVLLGFLLSLGHLSWPQFAVNAAISFVYSMSIGLPANLIFHRLKPRLHGRPALRQWGIYLGVMLAIVLVASMFVGVLMVVVGLVEASRLW